MRSTALDDRPRWLRVLIAVSLVAACQPPSPVEWREVSTIPEVGDSIRSNADIAARTVDTQGPVCAGSIRVASDRQGGLFAAWWAPRPDSNVVLLVSRRIKADSGAWTAPVTADARDQGKAGCRRPAPSIAADAARGYVHLAYYLDAPTGAGVYGGHSMESGTYFHDPVAIVYGDRPVATAIATSGDIVTVAYEDPNSEQARIALAISLTAGHLYEHRIDVSPTSMRATDPRVGLEERRVTVSWTAAEWEQGAQGSRAMMRTGTIGNDIKPGSGEDEE